MQIRPFHGVGSIGNSYAKIDAPWQEAGKVATVGNTWGIFQAGVGDEERFQGTGGPRHPGSASEVARRRQRAGGGLHAPRRALAEV